MTSPETAVLRKDVGTWDAEITVLSGPGAPSVSRGVLHNKLVAGDRWLVSEYHNESTGFGGHGLYGWDPIQGCYVGTWVDNQTRTLRIMRGQWDAATDTMTYEVEIDGPQPMTNRQITRTLDEVTSEFRSSIVLPDGEERVVMTALYRKR